jgi:retron-type reverse transcriptase
LALFPTDTSEIKNIIMSIKNSSACGIDQIPITVIKSVVDCISSVLASLINHSISKEIFPDALKIAKVIPIYKAGDKSLISSYRPISLLTTFSKVFEKVILKRLENFLEKHKLLSDNQFGFRKNRSTQLALTSYLDKLTEALDKNEYAISLFIDLSKAFDTIDHSLLLKKLYSYGIRGLAYDYIKSYLSNRLQYVETHGMSSSLLSITCGVPQGSILGPILFLLYINDISACTKLLKLFLFADDTTILYSSKDINELIKTMNKELETISDWFKLNKLSLNTAKTNYMIFKPIKNEIIHPNLLLNETAVVRVHSTRFLGVEIDEKLT